MQRIGVMGYYHRKVGKGRYNGAAVKEEIVKRIKENEKVRYMEKKDRQFKYVQSVMDDAIESLCKIYVSNMFASNFHMKKKLELAIEWPFDEEMELDIFENILRSAKSRMMEKRMVEASEVYLAELENTMRISQMIEDDYRRKPNAQMAGVLLNTLKERREILGLNRPASNNIVIVNPSVPEKVNRAVDDIKKMPVGELEKLLEKKRKMIDAAKQKEEKELDKEIDRKIRTDRTIIELNWED